MKKYQPNFNDPRVRRRCLTALEWVGKYITARPNWLSTREIDRHFGQGQLALSQWLRSKLLCVVDPYSNYLTGTCKTYCRNYDGYYELQQLLKPDQIQKIQDQHQTELETGNFSYTESNNREFHPLQWVKKEIRTEVLVKNGYRYDYDIVCAAPSLLYQQALALGLKPLRVIPEYIELRSEIRQYLSETHGIGLKQIKQILTGLFQGAYISKHKDSQVFQILEGNYLLIDRLRNDPFIQELQKEIKQMWSVLVRDMRSRGVLGQERIKGRDKARLYRELEEQVMKVIRDYLKKRGIQRFDIHDGFQTREMIDIEELIAYVKSHSHFMIKLDMFEFPSTKQISI